MNNENKNRSVSTAALIVAGVFVLCIVFIVGKVVFASNSETVPAGLDTNTINTDVTQPQVVETTAPPVTQPVVTHENGAVIPSDSSAESKADDTSSSAEPVGTMYITEYAYLHTQPSNEAENIVCMTPGVAVTVLNYEDNGYVKIKFTGTDGELTGYIYRDYLSDYQTVLPPWEQ